MHYKLLFRSYLIEAPGSSSQIQKITIFDTHLKFDVMELLQELLEVIKFVLPSLVVFFTAFYVLKHFFENEQRKRVQEIKLSNSSTITPVRLQAYERLVLLLERISPESMVMRTFKQGMTAHQLHTELLKTIRGEFEHNLSQQLYVSKAAWELARTSREELTKLINLAGETAGPNASGLDMSKVLLEMASRLEKLPNQVAIDFLKKEIKLLF